MTPRTLTPIATSLPFDDLEQGHLYRFTMRAWVRPPCCLKLTDPGTYSLTAVFVGLSSAGRGEQLRIDVYFPSGKGHTFYRAQIFTIERVNS